MKDGKVEGWRGDPFTNVGIRGHRENNRIRRGGRLRTRRWDEVFHYWIASVQDAVGRDSDSNGLFAIS